jgi:hypothetical protein
MHRAYAEMVSAVLAWYLRMLLEQPSDMFEWNSACTIAAPLGGMCSQPFQHHFTWFACVDETDWRFGHIEHGCPEWYDRQCSVIAVLSTNIQIVNR